MDLVYNLLVVLHLLGMAAVVGGWVAVRSGRTVTAPIVWGARAQLVTGLALVVPAGALAHFCMTVVLGSMVMSTLDLPRPEPDQWAAVVDRLIDAVRTDPDPS